MNEKVLKDLRKKGFRLTKPRIAIINLLNQKHLTFKELHKGLLKEGYDNLATVYNNIDFLIDNNLVTEIFLDKVKYYDLTIDNLSHDSKDHIHLMCSGSNKIIEIMDESIYQNIKDHEALKNYDINSIQISIKAGCRGKCNCKD